MPKFTEHAPGTPSWADLSTTDARSAVGFYGSLFRWTDDPQEMGPDASYHLQRVDGQSVVGIYQQSEEEATQNIPPHWNTYFTVQNADQTAQRVRDSGGMVLMEASDVFDAGRMAVVQDPQGAVFCVWQPNKHIGSELMQEPGTITWVELMTTDREQAGEFYKKVLPIETGPMPGQVPYTIIKVGDAEVAGMMNISDMGPEAIGVPPKWSVYFGTADADGTVEQAKSLGASVMVAPRDIPNIGRFAVLQDPQGAVFSVFQPNQANP